jgi:hypothetical protein
MMSMSPPFSNSKIIKNSPMASQGPLHSEGKRLRGGGGEHAAVLNAISKSGSAALHVLQQQVRGEGENKDEKREGHEEKKKTKNRPKNQDIVFS